MDNKFNGLFKKVRSDLKLVASYTYQEIQELGGLTKLLNDILKDAGEVEKLFERIVEEERRKEEQERLNFEKERRLQEIQNEEQKKQDRRALKKKSLR